MLKMYAMMMSPKGTKFERRNKNITDVLAYVGGFWFIMGCILYPIYQFFCKPFNEL